MSESKEKKSITKEHFEKKAEQTKKNLASGGKPVTVDLHKTVTVEFTSDYGYNKKGDVKTVSDTAYEIYNNKGVVTKVN